MDYKLTPEQARELATALNVAATNADATGAQVIDLQPILSLRLADSLDALAAAIAEAKAQG